MIFVARAASVAVAAFACVGAGFAVQAAIAPSLLAEAKSMISAVAGLEATLLALVLGLLIWTAHGVFTAQQAQLQTVGRAMVLLDFAFSAFGPGADAGRHELRKMVAQIRTRFWIGRNVRQRRVIYADMAAEAAAMREVFVALTPANEAQHRHLASARESFGTIMETQLTMLRSLVNPIPSLLYGAVVGWACVLFFGYGLTSAANGLSVFMAALGALSIGGAVLVIFELSDPYVGFFCIPAATFDEPMQAWSLSPTSHEAPSSP